MRSSDSCVASAIAYGFSFGSAKRRFASPEAVMYEPMADGTQKLVAVEYITSKGPASLEGQLFNFNSAPNRYGLGEFYELHVWAWKGNPTGTFADMNPKVSCEHAMAPSQ